MGKLDTIVDSVTNAGDTDDGFKVSELIIKERNLAKDGTLKLLLSTSPLNTPDKSIITRYLYPHPLQQLHVF